MQMNVLKYFLRQSEKKCHHLNLWSGVLNAYEHKNKNDNTIAKERKSCFSFKMGGGELVN